MNSKLKLLCFVGLVLVTTVGVLACPGSVDVEDPQEPDTRSEPEPTSSETTTIRARTSQAVPFAEVTVSIALDSRKGEPRISVDPEVAVITAHPRDRRKLSQVLWVVRCTMDGKLVVCPDRVRGVTIRAKKGCPEELFGGPLKINARKHNAIASGDPDLKMADHEYESFQARLQEQENSACDSQPINQRALESLGVDSYEGFAWRYDVVVTLENGKEVVLDPDLWIEQEED